MDPEGTRNIWTIENAPGSEPAPFLTGPESFLWCRIHPNGDWVAVVSSVSGRAEIFVTSFPKPGKRIPISVSGGREPNWSRDGEELFYVERNQLMAVQCDTSGGQFTVGIPKALFEKDFEQTYRFIDVDIDAERFLAFKRGSETTEVSIIENWFEELKRLAPHPEKK
jgi:hypothetical protein